MHSPFAKRLKDGTLEDRNSDALVMHATFDGIAARYKRLGISVRQGQKIKAYVAADGLIEEQEERTATGKLLRIRLTEKGRHSLDRSQ